MDIRFTKMHGAGNDFIIIDEFQKILIPEKRKSEFSAKISDRHFGIGSDGVIFIQKSKTEDAKMLFYNPDGSRAEVCGNGIRCFAKYLYDRKIVSKKNDKKKIRVETSLGGVISEILNGKIRADMGIPTTKFINKTVKINGNSYGITSINMGNPHAVIFLNNIEKIDVRTIGSSIRNFCEFSKNGTNVHFVQKIGNNRFKIRSYERGVENETLACGSGICASGVAAFVNKLADGRKKIKFHAKGGDLIIELETENERIKKVYMTGPAEEVFTGEIEF